jgi:hypothetical protein
LPLASPAFLPFTWERLLIETKEEHRLEQNLRSNYESFNSKSQKENKNLKSTIYAHEVTQTSPQARTFKSEQLQAGIKLTPPLREHLYSKIFDDRKKFSKIQQVMPLHH